jgi:hypothetical protein
VPMLPRGVYRAPYFMFTGEPLLIAIDGAHCITDWCVIRPGDDEAHLLKVMWERLDQQDPDNKRRKGRRPTHIGVIAGLLGAIAALLSIVVGDPIQLVGRLF